MADAAILSSPPLALTVTGMTCANCAGRVERALAAMPGVAAANVNLALERATVTLAPGAAITLGDAAAAVRHAGYAAREVRVTLAVQGMTCASCAGRVEKALNAAPGVIGATVNLATETAAIRVVAEAADPAPLIAVIRHAGYDARVEGDGVQEAAAADLATARRDRTELILAVILTAPLVGQMVLMSVGIMAHLPVWAEFALAAPVQIWIGRRFHIGAVAAIRAGTGNMDVLVAMGTWAAFLYSTALVLTRGDAAAGHLYFEASAVIITLVLFGKWLETRAKRSASAALRALMALRPDRATVLRAGAEIDVPIADVVRGDVVVVRPGERIAVDGVIIRGETEIDESLVTGEPLPVTRGKGDPAVAGSINGPGLIRIRAEAVGPDSTIARIAKMVAEAQTGKAPIQRLVDRISAVFVPVVLVLAMLTLAGWMAAGAQFEYAFTAAVSVLVIACPCALGLATPTALVAGTGAAARAGILIKDIETLERAGRIDTVIFDKTGTLTMGAPELSDICALGDEDEAALLTLAAAAQAGSEHPLGRAIIGAAKDRGLTWPEAEDFRAQIGAGVTATLDGTQIRMGRRDFAATNAAPKDVAAADALTVGGRTVIWLSRDGQALALFARADALRPDARGAVAALKARGLRVMLLTGDNRASAARIAEMLSIDEVEAEVRPEGKAAAVTALIAKGRRVAMVGDGINDAPALAAADLGVAMGGGADVAMETAGMALMRPRPSLVPAALSVARATARKIRQNLFWAFAYNLVCLPVAMMGWLDPSVAGAAMALSSVSVAGNALLLKRWRPEAEA
jgi:Cu+-exporting ATPase